MRTTCSTVVIVLLLCCPRAAAQEISNQELAEAGQLESMASISFSKKDFGQAEKLLQRSLALKERVLGADHPDVATTLHNLANVYQRTGKYAEADPLYLRAISIRESKLGASHPDTVQVLKDFACADQKRNSEKKADPNRARLIKRAQCLFADMGDACEMDGILNGKAAQLVLAQYPRGAQVSQRIYVYVSVNDQEKIVSANAPCGDNLLTKAAVSAAWQAKFKPKLVNGKGVPVSGVLVYNFVHQ